MSAAEKTISALIETQLPDFINSDHPQFKRFLELYYQWMEQNNPDGISNTAGNTIYHAMQMENYRDIDQTPPEFVKYFKDELLPYFPENTSLSTEKIIKAAREFYSKKGSDESLRWLFKALFDEDIEINYPKEQIFIASDGKWILPRAFRITVTEQNKHVNPDLLERRIVFGTSSGATCVVESANRNVDPTNGKEILEVYISNIKKYFENGETIEIEYVDENGSTQIFRERIIGTLSNIRVDSNIRTDPQQRRRGLFYNVGDPVVITGGLNITPEANDAAAIVNDVSQGSIEAVNMLFAGYGYRVYSNTEVIVLRSTGDDPNANESTDLRVLNVNLSACTSNSQRNFYEQITYDKTVIDYLSSVQIGTANLSAFTLNTRNMVINVTENDADDYFLNYAVVWANGNNYTDALFTAKIATPNGNTKILGTVNVNTSNIVIGTDTAFDVELKVGQQLQVGGVRRTIDNIVNNFYLTTTSGYSSTLTAQSAYRIGTFGAMGGFGTEATGGLLLYDIANTGQISTILAGATLNVLNTTDTSNGAAFLIDKTFAYNSITTYLVPTNANSQLFQALDFTTENTGGIALISVLNGGGGFRSEPDLLITSYYDTQLSENYDYNTEYENKANTRQVFKDLGLIAHVWINNGGTEYNINDIISFDGRGYGGNGYVQNVSSNGAITSVVLTDRGEGHLVRPNVIIQRLSPTYTTVNGTVNIISGNATVFGTNTEFTTDFNTTRVLRVNNELRRVATVINNTTLLVNTAFSTSGNANTIDRQNGNEATLTAYLFGDGEDYKIDTSAIGRVRDIRLIYRGFDYVNVPNVSLKVVDAILNPIANDVPFTETEFIYQGASFANSTFRANVKYYSGTSGLIRLYNYSGKIDVTQDLKTSNNIICNVNTSVNVPAPAQYNPAVIASGLPNPMYYGNGRARAKALFANGLIEFDGFFLNSDGFPSADKVFQDGDIYHNFSYIVQSEKNLVEFETPVKNIVHPAGMSLISKTVLKQEKDQPYIAYPNVAIIMPGNGTEAVTVTNSYSNVVTGFQTLFLPNVGSVQYSNSRVNVGDLFIIEDGLRLPVSRIVTAVNSNNQLMVDQNFLYAGQGKIRSNVTFANINGTVTVNPAVTGTVNINSPITGTVNVVANSNVVVGNNSTTFTTNLTGNSIVTINNQSRLVSNIVNNEYMIVDTPFIYEGTDNIAYLASNVILGTGTNFDPQLNVGDIITVNNEIREVTNVISDTVCHVNSVFTYFGSGKSLYKANTKVLGVGTFFDINLALPEIIKVNNQVREVVTIDSGTLLTVNTPFDYFGTGNAIAQLSNTILTIYDNANGVEELVLQSDNISFNIFPGNLMMAQSGNVEIFTTNTKVVGVGTTFVGNVVANDIIMISNQIRRVVNVANDTILNVNAAFTANDTGELVYKRASLVNAEVVSVSGNNLVLNVAFNANVSDLIYIVAPNYRQIVNVGGLVNITSNVITSNASDPDTLSTYVGKIYIGNEVITSDYELRTVVGVTANTITVDANFDVPGDDKYLQVYENHTFNVVTLTAY